MLTAIGVFTATLLAALAVTSGNAFAAARTWDGGGSDDNFSTAANWDTDTAPVNGDSLVFPTDVIFAGCSGSNSDVTLGNDLDSGSVTLAGLSVTGGKPDGCYSDFTISGNLIKLSGNLLGSPSGVYENLYIPSVEIANDITISNVITSATIDIGSHNLTFQASSSSSGLIGSGNVIISDNIGGGSGGGGCAISVPTGSEFSGDNSGFSGSLTLQNAIIYINSATDDLANRASSITSSGGSLIGFYLANGTDMEYSKPLNINGGRIWASQVRSDDNCNIPTTKKLTISGDITLSADTEVGLDYADIHFTGDVAGKEHLKLQSGGVGSLIFADGSTTKSELKVVTIADASKCYEVWNASSSNTKAIVNTDCSAYISFTDPQSPFETSGILAGVGKVGHIKILNGGVIAPGLSPGTLTTGNITWVEGGNYEFEIGKDGADKIVAIGTVTLGNGTLKVLRYQDYVPKAGDAYTIIENDGSDAVSGVFKDLPEGATFSTEDGGVYKISYKGGDGNDVIVTVVSAPKVPNTGFELLKNNPVATLLTTTAAAGIIVAIAKKRVSSKA